MFCVVHGLTTRFLHSKGRRNSFCVRLGHVVGHAENDVAIMKFPLINYEPGRSPFLFTFRLLRLAGSDRDHSDA